MKINFLKIIFWAFLSNFWSIPIINHYRGSWFCFNLTVAFSNKKKKVENCRHFRNQKIINMINLTLHNCSFTCTSLMEIHKGFSWKLKTITVVSKIYLVNVLLRRFLIKSLCDPYYKPLLSFMIQNNMMQGDKYILTQNNSPC